MYRFFLRPLLFLLPPEKAHHAALSGLKVICCIPGLRFLIRKISAVPSGAINVQGISFPGPVGLAAGFDKNGRVVDEMALLGFGFVEVGTVTPRPQKGNPRPRLFRLPADKALINRMGFNNEGVDVVAKRLARRRSAIPVGGNIGKNKDTPNEQAIADYEYCFDRLHHVVDYFVVNVSSPNTPGLRDLQSDNFLTELLGRLTEKNKGYPKEKPVFLKIAPDLPEEGLEAIVKVVMETGTAGIIATNTTVSRDNLKTSGDVVNAYGNGGLSGAPLQERSDSVIRLIREKSNGKVPVIGVGGIMEAAGAFSKMDSGAVLVQVYTGFVYQGPSLIHQINRLHRKHK